MTRYQQIKTVAECLALTLLDIGIERLPGADRLDFAFSHAWEAWEARDKYPHIKADPLNGDLPAMILKSSRRTGTFAEWRPIRGGFEVVYAESKAFGPDEALELRTGEEGPDAWRALASALMRELDEMNEQRIERYRELRTSDESWLLPGAHTTNQHMSEIHAK